MLYSSAADKQLIESWLTGNEKAFEHLFLRYYSKLYHHCLKCIADRSVAEEMTMDVLFRVWQKKETIDPERSFSAYVFTAIANRLIDHFRKQRVRTLSLDERFMVPSSAFIADRRLLQKEMDAIYLKGLNELSPKKKRVFVMSRMQGRSYREIAGMLNLSKNTIENHMVASLRQMKSFVKREVI